MDTKETNTPLPKEDEEIVELVERLLNKEAQLLTEDAEDYLRNILTLKNKQIEDTLQTLLDSEELQERPLEDEDGYWVEDPSLTNGHNQAITAIRNKITSMLDNQQ